MVEQTPPTEHNTNKDWTPNEEIELVKLAAKNTPTRVIGLKMGRSEDAIRAKAQDMRLSLKPTNQSPAG